MGDAHCVLHPYLWKNTSHDGWSDDVCGPPMRYVVCVIQNMMLLGRITVGSVRERHGGGTGCGIGMGTGGGGWCMMA